MFTHNKQIQWIAFLLLAFFIATVICTPMYYKKTDEETYEPDLVPVSSTVIPLFSYHLNSTGAVKHHALPLDEEEYRIAYMKHMLKKRKQAQDDPDTLITIFKKYHPDKKVNKKTASEHVAVVDSA